MGRNPRIEYNGGMYHVISRGNNREHILKESSDKQYFIDQMKEFKNPFGLKIFAYVLMDNHYHFLLQTTNKPLHTIMHQLNNRYSKYFNKKYLRSGHVFEGRYKAILVLDERYLLELVRYLHQNPVRAKMCSKVDEYPWSSDIFYRKNDESLVDIGLVLDTLSEERSVAIKMYTECIDQIPENTVNYEKGKGIDEDTSPVMNSSKVKYEERKTLDELLLLSGASPNDLILLKQGSRKRHLTPYKLNFIQSSIEEKYSLSEIGRVIGMSSPAVYDLVMRYKLKV